MSNKSLELIRVAPSSLLQHLRFGRRVHLTHMLGRLSSHVKAAWGIEVISLRTKARVVRELTLSIGEVCSSICARGRVQEDHGTTINTSGRACIEP